MKRSKIITLGALLIVLFAFTVTAEAAIDLYVTPDSVKADGKSQINVAARVTGWFNLPVANAPVSFFTTAGTLSTNRVRTNGSGLATVTLTSGLNPGEITVMAKYFSQYATARVILTESIILPPITLPQGIFSLLSSEIPVESLLTNESVAGISIRASWNSMEPEEGAFNWSYIDTLLSNAENAGKKVSLTILPGVSTPEWVYAKGAQKFSFIYLNPEHPTSGEELYCPIPWDEVYLTSWRNFIEALAARYGKNPTVAWIRITGPMNTVSAEWNLQAKEEWDKYIGTENEFSDEKLIVSIKKVTDWFAAAFPLKPLSIAIARTKITDSPPFLRAATEVTNYGFSSYPAQFLIQMNGWKNNVPTPDIQVPDTELFKQYAPLTGAQMVWSATNDQYCRMNNRETPCDPYTSLAGAVELAKDYQLSFLEIYAEDIINADLQGILEQF